jgi:serine/threonine-protein kinase
MDLASGIAFPPLGLVWDARGRVFFGVNEGSIWQIPPEGVPKAVTTVGDAEMAHGLPQVLPGEQVLLYTARKRQSSWGDEEIVAHTLATGERKILLQDAADARYVPTGHLVFLRRGTLFAVPFDAERLKVQGAPVAVLDAVVQALTARSTSDITGAGQFAVAATGTLAWIPGPVAPYAESALAMVDRRGQVSPLPAPVRAYWWALRPSPDGRRLAVPIQTLTEIGLWLYDLDRGVLTRLAGGGEVSGPVWTPDGHRLVFGWLKDGRKSLAAQPADGTAPPQVLVAGRVVPSSFTRDGRQLAALLAGDIVIVTVEKGQASMQPLFQTPDTERWPEFSPDGRWLAYGSNVSGRNELYVRPYPGPGPAQLVSIDGASSPAWNPNGRELFFVSGPDPAGKCRMITVEFEPGSPPRIGRPRPLFEFDPSNLFVRCDPVRCYDVAPDGQRFYAMQARNPPPRSVVTHINLIQNWFEELKAKVPVR